MVTSLLVCSLKLKFFLDSLMLVLHLLLCLDPKVLSSMNETIDQSRMCSVGLLTTDCYDDLGNFIIQADDAGHDFIVTPISHTTFRRVLNEEKTTGEQDQRNWKDRPVFDRKDLVIQSAGKLKIIQSKCLRFQTKIINTIH